MDKKSIVAAAPLPGKRVRQDKSNGPFFTFDTVSFAQPCFLSSWMVTVV